ncbi:MAG TPA: hypothetical protein VM487_02390 [Phycisphaerae bacterium]|nr:hypothetical protein [Phycisphaerae bacterium]
MAFVSMVVLNTSRVHPDSGVPVIECCELVGGDPDDRVPWGECPNMGALGVTALPYPPSEDGTEFAQGVVIPDVGGNVGVIVGGRDSRTAEVYGQLSPGESALHTTGPDFDASVMCKDQLVSIMVGDDMCAVFDRKNKVISITGFGCLFEMSEANGVLIGEPDGAGLSLKKGCAWLKGTSYMLGDTPILPPAIGPQPGLVSTGGLAS